MKNALSVKWHLALMFIPMIFSLNAQEVEICATSVSYNNLLNPASSCVQEVYSHSYSTDPAVIAAFPPISLNVYFWGINQDNGTSADPLTLQHVLSAIDLLNSAFSETNICFNLSGYDYIDETDYYEPVYSQFHNYLLSDYIYENVNAIDIYIPHQLYYPSGKTLKGVAWPSDLELSVSMDHIDGGILVHEMGHVLGLHHTFSGCENVTRDPNDLNYNADCAGDYVTDTNAVPDFFDYPHAIINHDCQYIGDETDCEGTPYIINEADVKNYMSYTFDSCRSVFTTGQGIRVRETIIDISDNGTAWELDYTSAINADSYDLFLRNSVTDVGAEPDINTGNVIWDSPDIWIRNHPDGIEQHENPEYTPNDPTYVYVRVKNNSCKASTDQEDMNLYWAKANTFFDWPAYWTAYVESGVLMADQLGSFSIPPLDPGEEIILSFQWYMPDPNHYTEINPNSNEWHFCLLARLTSAHDPISYTDGSPIGPYVRNNNNVAWKNLTVVDFQPDGIIGGVIAVGNAFFVQKSFDLQFVPQENELGNAIFEEAEVKIELSDPLYEAWQQGGGQMVDIKEGRQEKVKIITGPNAALKHIKFDSGENGSLYLSFNFLTEEVSDKLDFKYHVIQSDASNQAIIGGETYQIKKKQRPMFLAGTNQPTTQNNTTSYSAMTIGEPAVYNWYGPNGNLIHSGTNLTLNDDEFGEYTLEVVASEDGYKDYQKIPITSPFSIESIFPNPATNQVAVGYNIGTGNTAYLMLTNAGSTITNNYILGKALSEITLDISSYPAGVYVISLICNSQWADSKNLIIQ